MELLVDGMKFATTADSISDAIRHGAEMADRDGRCVVEVYVDGERADAPAIEALDDTAGGAEEVRLVTATPGDVVRDAFVHAGDTLEQVDVMQQEAADLLQQDRIPDAMQLLQQAITGWMQVQQAVSQGAAFASLDLNTAPPDAIQPVQVIAALNDHLVGITESLRLGDTIGLTDTLLYEMPNVVIDWRRLLDELANRLDDTTADDAGAGESA